MNLLFYGKLRIFFRKRLYLEKVRFLKYDILCLIRVIGMEKRKKNVWTRVVTWILCISCMSFLLADPLKNSQKLPQILFISAAYAVVCSVIVYRMVSFEKKDIYIECVKWSFFILMTVLYILM